MRKIHTILRLHFEAKLSRREIATSQQIGYGTVVNYLARAVDAGITWPLPPEIGERELGALLFPNPPSQRREGYFEPDFAEVQQELKHPGMTKLLAWLCQNSRQLSFPWSGGRLETLYLGTIYGLPTLQLEDHC